MMKLLLLLAALCSIAIAGKDNTYEHMSYPPRSIVVNPQIEAWQGRIDARSVSIAFSISLKMSCTPAIDTATTSITTQTNLKTARVVYNITTQGIAKARRYRQERRQRKPLSHHRASLRIIQRQQDW